jgi:hypothetical protein
MCRASSGILFSIFGVGRLWVPLYTLRPGIFDSVSMLESAIREHVDDHRWFNTRTAKPTISVSESADEAGSSVPLLTKIVF